MPTKQSTTWSIPPSTSICRHQLFERVVLAVPYYSLSPSAILYLIRQLFVALADCYLYRYLLLYVLHLRSSG